jgi:cytochrome c biogenesis protein ResB
LRELIKRAGDIKVFFVLALAFVAAMVAAALLPEKDLYHQAWFPVLLGLIGVNLAACILARWDSLAWPSIVVHGAILIIMLGSVISLAWGQRAELVLHEGSPASDALTGPENRPAGNLPFSVRLRKFDIEYYGKPTHKLEVVERKTGRKSTLEVEAGQSYNLQGIEGRLEVLRFLPDFSIDLGTREASSRTTEPNNPALQLKISVKGAAGRTFWVFANFPLQHQEDQPWEVLYEHQPASIKQFTSRLEVLGQDGQVALSRTVQVNHPMRYRGWTLYQSSYDPEHAGVSIFQVAHDPGTGLVFAGCVLLMIGLSFVVAKRF